MPTNLPNRAQITYTFGGTQSTTVSNQTNTTLNEQYTLALTKTALSDTAETGGNATYVLRLENTGAGNLYNVTITDDLGTAGTTTAPLSVAGTTLYYVNGTPVAGTQTPGANNIAFSTATVLAPGDNFVVVYNATVAEGTDGTVTNSATATANGGTATGDAVTTDAQEAITVTTPTAASLAILKAADKDTVVSGDTLTYTFTLINTGTQAADAITITDTFPPEFTVNTIAITENGVTTPVAATEYTITDNTLTLPGAGSTLVITTPAATVDGPGIVVVTVSGTVA